MKNGNDLIADGIDLSLLVIKLKLEILQSLGGLYDGLAFYALHWSYAPSL